MASGSYPAMTATPPTTSDRSGEPLARPFRLWQAAFAALFLAGAVLVAVPSLDLAVSGWFYVPGESFPANHASAYHRAVRVAVKVVAIGWIVFAITGVVMAKVRRRGWFGFSAAIFIYFLGLMALGPGLVVNEVLKNHWDRARPSQIETFGGTRIFTRALMIADQCPRNCAFVSGDASVGFMLTAFGFAAASAAGGRRRRLAHAGFAAGSIAGAWIGLTRIAQGGHFLSDIVFAGIVTIGLAWLLSFALPWMGRLLREPQSGDP